MNFPVELISDIAQSIDCGMVCIVNTHTLEVEDIPWQLIEDPAEFEAMTGETFESMGVKHTGWENYITIEPLASHESFEIMKQFAEKMVDPGMQNVLFNCLGGRRPFANFKSIVEDSPCRKDWFEFKQQKLEEYVTRELESNGIRE